MGELGSGHSDGTGDQRRGGGTGGDLGGAERDAADIVRAAFTQAERLTRQADEARAAATVVLEDAQREAERVVEAAKVEREQMIADARRDRVAAEEVLMRARREAQQEADDVLARAGELARAEAEILLEGSRMELLRARDEASSIRATAQRDADALLAAAHQRARSTSADLLAATRRRLGDTIGPVAPAPAERREVVDVTDDRPPPGSHDTAAETGESEPSAPARVAVAERSYRNDTPRQPREDDIDALLQDAVSRAVRAAFRRRRRRNTVR